MYGLSTAAGKNSVAKAGSLMDVPKDTICDSLDSVSCYGKNQAGTEALAVIPS